MHKDHQDIAPPKFAKKALKGFIKKNLYEEVEGDLEERFFDRLNATNTTKARLDYWFQVLMYLRPFAVKQLNLIPNNPTYMLSHNFKISFRSLLKNKGFALLNIGGLALGIMVALLISLWIFEEINYDKQYDDFDRIAQTMQNQTFSDEVRTWESQAMQLAPVLREEYGHLFEHVITSNFGGTSILKYQEKQLNKNGNFMEPGIIDMLSLNMIKGTKNALKDISSVVLSESTAKDIFGSEDPMEKEIDIDGGMLVKVAGVYEDLPVNSTFGQLSFIAPWDLLKNTANFEERVGWGNSWFRVFVQLNEGVDMELASQTIKDAKRNNIDPEHAERSKPEIFLHPMSKWYLYGQFENGKNVGGLIGNIWLFGISGFFVLLLACINFINLSTARADKRFKEIGIRKTVGSNRSQLIGQFLVESILVVIFAYMVAIVLSYYIFPTFNGIIQKSITIPWTSPIFWIGSAGFVIIVGLLSGSYPAFYLSGFRPIHVLKGLLKYNKQGVTPRKAFVTFQFVVSISLIIATLTVLHQIEFAKNRPMGYQQDNIVTVPIKNGNIMRHYDAMKQELMQKNDILNVAASDVKITSTFTTNGGFNWSGKDPAMHEEFNTLRASHGYGDLVGWEVIKGRDFSPQFKSDSLAFVVNETAVEYMGFEDPIGQKVEWGDNASNGTFEIIGVIKDMITISPYDQVRPMIFILHRGRFINFINLKINPESNVQDALAHAGKVFGQYDTENPFEYQFADEAYARNFRNEERVAKLVSFFAVIAILISCIGLLGVSFLLASQRKKEISIRKVLGAEVESLVFLLSKEFVYIVIIALVIATPISYYFLQDWLNNFDYKSTLGPSIFILSGVIVMGVTILIVTVNSLKVALMKPGQTLRSEV